jgi:tight adherence protein C
MNEQLITLLGGISVGIIAYLFTSKLPIGKEKKGEISQDNISQDNFIDADIAEGDRPLRAYLDRLPSLSQAISQHYQKQNMPSEHPLVKCHTAIDLLLIRGGNPKNLSSDHVIDLTFYSSLICGLFMYLYAESLSIPSLLCAYIGLAFGAILPWSLFNLAAGKRQIAIRKELPYLLDLLTLCVESGMDFTTALIRIGPTFKDTALGSEVGLLVTEMRMGKSRQESLRDLSHRVGLMELSTAVNAIIQSDKLGASMGPALRIQSEDMRRKRILLAEESGMKAPVKLLFPLVMFIFPTTFIVLFAPMLIKML